MRIATIGQNEFISSQINSLNFQLQQTEFQIASGLRSQSYSGLSADGGKLLDFESSTRRFTAYIESIDQAERRLDVSQSAIAQFEGAVTSARSEYFSVQPYYRLDSGVRATAEVQFETTIREMTRVLNANFEGRFLFGNNTTDQSGLQAGETQLIEPFEDIIAGVDANLPGGNFTAADLENAINQYLELNNGTGLINVDGGGDDIEAGYFNGQNYDDGGQAVVRLDEGSTIQYGIDANEIGIRRAFKGVLQMYYTMRHFEAPPADTFTTENEAVSAFDDGFSNVEQGLQDIRVLVGQTGVKQETLKQVRAEHETTLALLDQQSAEIRDADSFEAITEFQRLQVQLQASYQVTAQVNQLTLANFI